MTDHQPPPAVEAIGRLEELARAATHQSWAAFTDDSGPSPHTNLVSFSPRTDCAVSIPGVHKTDPNIAYIAAANPQAILYLIESLRHSVEREAGLREALEPFADCTKYTGEHDGDDEHPSWSPFIPVSAYRKARAALDRRAGT